jgi:hypothetical protein
MNRRGGPAGLLMSGITGRRRGCAAVSVQLLIPHVPGEVSFFLATDRIRVVAGRLTRCFYQNTHVYWYF